MRISQPAWAALVAAATLIGCGGEDGPASPASVPVGFVLPHGARPLAPGPGGALAAVSTHPVQVWTRLERMLARRYPDRRVEQSGCGNDDRGEVACALVLVAKLPGGRYRRLSATLSRPPDDPGARYLVTLNSGLVRGPGPRLRRPPPLPGVVRVRPGPVRRHRPAPRPGDPIAPSDRLTGARRRLLPGTRLVAARQTPAVGGGLDVVLRVLPGHGALALARAYARQVNGSGPIRVVRHGRETELTPPPEPGGIGGSVTLLDRPGDEADLIGYLVFND